MAHNLQWSCLCTVWTNKTCFLVSVRGAGRWILLPLGRTVLPLVFRQLWERYRSSLTLCKKANKHIFPKCQTILLNFHTNYLDLLEALCSWIDEFPQMRVEATYWNCSQVLQVVTLFKYKDGSGTPVVLLQLQLPSNSSLLIFLFPPSTYFVCSLPTSFLRQCHYLARKIDRVVFIPPHLLLLTFVDDSVLFI